MSRECEAWQGIGDAGFSLQAGFGESARLRKHGPDAGYTKDRTLSERLINLDVDRQKVKDSPPWDPALPLDREHENRMAGHFARADPDLAPDPLAKPLNPDWR